MATDGLPGIDRLSPGSTTTEKGTPLGPLRDVSPDLNPPPSSEGGPRQQPSEQ